MPINTFASSKVQNLINWNAPRVLMCTKRIIFSLFYECYDINAHYTPKTIYVQTTAQ